jgi:protein phosphatase 4 regulatory subunit 3
VLAALKFFRTCIALQDAFYNAQMIQDSTFELILNIVYDSMPRDNLLNSACLELFEFIKRENIKPIILHVVEKYRDKLKEITYVDTFLNLTLRYDQMQSYNAAEMDATLFSQDEDALRKQMNGGQRWHGLKEADATEEEYFNTSDDEDENAVQQQRKLVLSHAPNGGASPLLKALVDYPDDDDDIMMDARAEQPRLQPSPLPDNPPSQQENEAPSEQPSTPTLIQQNNLQSPPERLSEKRRREEDDDDELNKLSSFAGSGSNKRRSSSSSVSNLGSGSGSLRRRKNFLSVGKNNEANANSSPVLNTRQGNTATEAGGQQPASGGGGGGSKKIAISLSAHLALKGNGGRESNKEGTEENDTA